MGVPILQKFGPKERGFSVLELVVTISVFLIALVPLGQLVHNSSRAFSSLAGRTHVATRGQVVMDRLLDEVMAGRFISLDPPVPEGSSRIRFERVVGMAGGV